MNKSNKDIIWVCDRHLEPQYNMGVIYRLFCIDTGKSYIGQTRYFSAGNRLHGPLKNGNFI